MNVLVQLQRRQGRIDRVRGSDPPVIEMILKSGPVHRQRRARTDLRVPREEDDRLAVDGLRRDSVAARVMSLPAVGTLEDIRGELARLLDDADPDTGLHARLEALVRGVDEAVLVARGVADGCSLCEAGHAPARSCSDAREFGAKP